MQRYRARTRSRGGIFSRFIFFPCCNLFSAVSDDGRTCSTPLFSSPPLSSPSFCICWTQEANINLTYLDHLQPHPLCFSLLLIFLHPFSVPCVFFSHFSKISEATFHITLKNITTTTLRITSITFLLKAFFKKRNKRLVMTSAKDVLSLPLSVYLCVGLFSGLSAGLRKNYCT